MDVAMSVGVMLMVTRSMSVIDWRPGFLNLNLGSGCTVAADVDVDAAVLDCCDD